MATDPFTCYTLGLYIFAICFKYDKKFSQWYCVFFGLVGNTHLTEDTVPVVMESVLEKLDFR